MVQKCTTTNIEKKSTRPKISATKLVAKQIKKKKL